MGDRANIVLRYNDVEHTSLYLYTHWEGSEWPEKLRLALVNGKPRWDDEAYLARIIMSNVYMDSHTDTTGGGIAPYACDNEHPFIYVNFCDQTVTISDTRWTFAEYIAQKEATYPND